MALEFQIFGVGTTDVDCSREALKYRTGKCRTGK